MPSLNEKSVDGIYVMVFDPNDENDERIVECSSCVLHYPNNVEQAPEKEGVYILIHENKEVLCVGIASGSTLKEEIQEEQKHDYSDIVKIFRWFVTKNGETAEKLGTEWIRKYCINN